MKSPDNPPLTTVSNTIDFTKPPTEILEYKLGEPITRENFMSFIIMSFAISRGQPPCQRSFFEWLKTHFGVNARGAVQRFIRSYDLTCFTEDEKKLFQESFAKVSAHDDSSGFGNLHTELVQIGTLTTTAFDVSKIENLGQFRESVADYIKNEYHR